MAAQPQTAPQSANEPSIADLRRISNWQLEPLLQAETEEWREKLDWDYSKSADLVRHHTSTGSLAGAALLQGDAVVGYGYTILEDDKGLIGDLYVRPEWRGTRSEGRLFLALLQELINSPSVRRVESQLLLIDNRTAMAVAGDAGFRLYERTLMSAGVETLRAAMARRAPPAAYRLEPWGAQWCEAAATVIMLAYRGHVDAELNDQYRTYGAAAHFLNNLIEFPGCGTFFAPGCIVAFDRVTGRPAGIALCSFVAPQVGHLTQLCVTPEAQSKGLGYAMLREAVLRLSHAGAVRFGLTVTLANQAAVKLYAACGFREIKRFFAYTKEI